MADRNRSSGGGTMSGCEGTIDRKRFLAKSAALLAGGAAFASTALSYGRIVGANDRVALAHIGNGSRGADLDWIVSQLKSSHNVEMTTVCALWRVNREQGIPVVNKYYGLVTRRLQSLGDVT